MPTIEEDFSDPEEELLPSAPAPAPKRAQKAATPRAVQYSQSAPEAAKRSVLRSSHSHDVLD